MGRGLGVEVAMVCASSVEDARMHACGRFKDAFL
jgi:hypothetical protein